MKAQLVIDVQHAGQLPLFTAGMKGFAVPATNIPNAEGKFYFIHGFDEILINRNEFATGWDNSIVWCEIINRTYKATGKLPELWKLGGNEE